MSQNPGGVRLSPQQTHLFKLGGVNHGYWVQGQYRLTGAVDAVVLESALTDVARRHEILRTTFPPLEGLTIPLQLVHDESSLVLSGQELGDGPESARVEAACRREWTQTLDLQSPPLVRSCLLALSPVEHILVTARNAY